MKNYPQILSDLSILAIILLFLIAVFQWEYSYHQFKTVQQNLHEVNFLMKNEIIVNLCKGNEFDVFLFQGDVIDCEDYQKSND